MPVTEDFLLERKPAIGGSDVLHLVGLPPFGCERRLWYDKAKVPEDFPFRGNRHTERGSHMEEYAATWWYERHAMSLKKVRWKVMDGHPMIGCHADRLYENEGGYLHGVLELKVPQARTFLAVRARPDPPNEAALQDQWCMMAWGLSEGHVALWSPDQWDGVSWKVAEDKGQQADFVKLALAFWATLKAGEPPYPRLSPQDKRCRTCPWRGTCQGMGRGAESAEEEEALSTEGVSHSVDQSQGDLAIIEWVAARKRLLDAKESMEVAKARLKGMFPQPGHFATNLGKVSLKVVNRKGYTTTVKPSTYELLNVKPSPQILEGLDDERSLEAD